MKKMLAVAAILVAGQVFAAENMVECPCTCAATEETAVAMSETEMKEVIANAMVVAEELVAKIEEAEKEEAAK